MRAYFVILLIALCFSAGDARSQINCNEMIRHYSNPKIAAYATNWMDNVINSKKALEYLSGRYWSFTVNNYKMDKIYENIGLDENMLGFPGYVLRLYVEHFSNVPKAERGAESIKYIELFAGREPGVRIKRKLTPEQEAQYQLDERKIPKADYQINDRISIYCRWHY